MGQTFLKMLCISPVTNCQYGKEQLYHERFCTSARWIHTTAIGYTFSKSLKQSSGKPHKRLHLLTHTEVTVLDNSHSRDVSMASQGYPGHHGGFLNSTLGNNVITGQGGKAGVVIALRFSETLTSVARIKTNIAIPRVLWHNTNQYS